MCSYADSFLSGGSIKHEQNFLRLDDRLEVDQFLHQILINLQTACGIENQNITRLRPRCLERRLRDFTYILLTL